ncbi:hypothetical protein FGO68_gene17007 [Halteria grandinella]|uniref:C2H2-type domain-containing protein n=1 Tax=Halteria grandinella TaxID=5974 RepID=A0A8J8NMA5_HALGN|nr:hypothetical protein FGO68_gene17007 [Halteria grandinella]
MDKKLLNENLVIEKNEIAPGQSNSDSFSSSPKELFQIGKYDIPIDVKLSMVKLPNDIIGKIKSILNLPELAELECFDGDFIDVTNRCRTHIPDSKDYLVIRYVRPTSARLTNAFMCTFEGCSKIFPKWHNLFDHLRIHTGEKPFMCPVKGCIASFNQTANQKKHIDTHKLGDSLPCRNCGVFQQRPHINLKLQQKLALMSHNKQKYSNLSFQGLNENVKLKLKDGLDCAQNAK